MKQPSAGTALFLLATLLTGCGARSAGFVNETAMHSDTQLMQLWHQAQQDLAQQIDLNPIQHIRYGTPETILPGDPRALSFNPLMITVRVIPDMTPDQLLVYGLVSPEPTGMIICPQPCDGPVARAYSTPSRYRTHIAASWEHNEPDWEFIVVYEFENHILYGLGYDTSWR